MSNIRKYFNLAGWLCFSLGKCISISSDLTRPHGWDNSIKNVPSDQFWFKVSAETREERDGVTTYLGCDGYDSRSCYTSPPYTVSIVKIRKLSTFIYTLGPGEVAVIFGVQRQYFRSLSAFHRHQLSRYVGWKHLEILGPLVGFELMLTVISVSRDFPAHRWILSWWQRDPGTKVQPVIVQGCPRQNVCSIHSLIGEGWGGGRNSVRCLHRKYLRWMQYRQTGTSMLLGEV